MWLKVCVIVLLSVASRCVNSQPQQKVDAAQLREQADRALQSGNSESAIRLLTSLIQVEPTRQINFYKRSVAYMFANKYELALSDATKAIELDPQFTKAYLHRGKIKRRLGDCHAALADFQSLESIDRNNKDLPELMQSARRCVELDPLASHLHGTQNWGELRHVLNELTQIATNSRKYLEWEIDALLHERDYETLIASAGKLLLFDKNNMHAYLQRGNAYLLTGNEDMALKHYKEGLRFNPEHKGLKAAFRKLRQIQKFEENSTTMMNNRDYLGAIVELDAALNVDPDNHLKNKQFYFTKCKALKMVGKLDEAIAACSAALQIDGNMLDVLTTRGDLYLKKELFEDAVRDYENAHRINPHDHSINEGLHNARFELKKSQRKDYYKILGVDMHADDATIKKAYRKAALKYHPDKQVGATDEEKEIAEKMFKDVAESYEVLSNPEKRGRFDRGEDLQDQQQGFNPFQGGGTPFGFGGPGGFQFHFRF
eukprot:TRINITY_DN793_c0_g2_i2.p2 TRINITY_DN793_c0_g2~~TRINITY_DN793_c0_g2_i2.p2  ORF type:complete len:496 (+),score=151.53 TRINITY_DN793_c0_g2_i2:31-1488(+)